MGQSAPLRLNVSEVPPGNCSGKALPLELHPGSIQEIVSWQKKQDAKDNSTNLLVDAIVFLCLGKVLSFS